MKYVLILALLLTIGCAIRKPVKAAYDGMYCEERSADGKHCIRYAKHNYPCTHDVYGDCQK